MRIPHTMTEEQDLKFWKLEYRTKAPFVLRPGLSQPRRVPGSRRGAPQGAPELAYNYSMHLFIHFLDSFFIYLYVRICKLMYHNFLDTFKTLVLVDPFTEAWTDQNCPCVKEKLP